MGFVPAQRWPQSAAACAWPRRRHDRAITSQTRTKAKARLCDAGRKAQPRERLAQAQDGQQRARGGVAVRHLRRGLVRAHLRVHRRHVLCAPPGAPGCLPVLAHGSKCACSFGWTTSRRTVELTAGTTRHAKPLQAGASRRKSACSQPNASKAACIQGSYACQPGTCNSPAA